MEIIDKIETLDAIINNGQVTVTPPVIPIVLSDTDYLAQLNQRLNDLTQSKINTQTQLDSINQAIADVNSKIMAVPVQ
jgi:hypothetical protein